MSGLLLGSVSLGPGGALSLGLICSRVSWAIVLPWPPCGTLPRCLRFRAVHASRLPKPHASQNSCFHSTVIRKIIAITILSQKVCGVTKKKKKKKCCRNPPNHIIGKISGDIIREDEKISGSEMGNGFGWGQSREYVIVPKNRLSELFLLFRGSFHLTF